MANVLFISHADLNCGVHQFGTDLAEALRIPGRHRFTYAECTGPKDLLAAYAAHRPDVVIFNWHQLTLPWLTDVLIWKSGATNVAIVHEITNEIADEQVTSVFDYSIAADPTLRTTNADFFATGRLIPAYRPQTRAPSRTTVGSFGFATPGKNFKQLVAMVNAQFDDCAIRLHIPPSHFCDPTGEAARAIAAECREQITKPGISLEIGHDFFTREELIEFLAGNSLNAFLYTEQGGRGISSAVDFALSAGRPIALSRTSMFRHLTEVTPSPFVEDSTLPEILAHGFSPFQRFRDAWTAGAIRERYDLIVDTVVTRQRLDVLNGRIVHLGTMSRDARNLRTQLSEIESKLQRTEAVQAANLAWQDDVVRQLLTRIGELETAEQARRQRRFPFRHPVKWLSRLLKDTHRFGTLR